MKKYIGYILSISIVLSALAFTNAEALTVGDIAMLQAAGIISASQAASLTASLGTQSMPTKPDIAPASTADCAVISVDLSYTTRDNAKNDNGVSVLQDFLNSNNYLASLPTGYFGRLTVAAVKAFQKANGLSVTGKADAATRAKIQDIDCNGLNTETSSPLINQISTTNQTTAVTTNTTPFMATTNSFITINYPQAGYSLYNGLGKGDGTAATNPIAKISWNISKDLAGQPIEIDLFNSASYLVKVIARDQYTGTYSWNYDPTISSGNYYIQISPQNAGKGNGVGASTGIFYIQTSVSVPPVSSVLNLTPVINYLSSNQGQPGDVINVYGSNFYLGKGAGMKVQFLQNGDVFKTIENASILSSTQLQFMVPNKFDSANNSYNYQIRLQSWDGVSNWVSSNSVNFSISSSNIVIPTPIPPVTSVSGLNISVNPSATNITGSTGQTGATLGQFVFTNTSATPAVATGIELQRGGASTDSSVGNITLYNGSAPIIGGGNFFANGMVWFLGSNVLTIPSNSSVTVTAKGDITGSVGQTVAVGIGGVTGNVSVNTSYPVMAPTMTITAPLATACTTQGSNTAPGGIAADNNGLIGCDIVANGTFDLSKSYCRGQLSGKQQTLIPDGYGRKNWFYTTLYNLYPNEHVDVVINSNGREIKCSPLPAGVPEHSGYVQ